MPRRQWTPEEILDQIEEEAQARWRARHRRRLWRGIANGLSLLLLLGILIWGIGLLIGW